MKKSPFPTISDVNIWSGFLERYRERLGPEETKALAVWEEQLCASRVLDNEAVRVRHSAAFVRVQDFLAKFAAEIVVLQKQNLREVVMCSQAKTYAGRKKAQHFVVGDSGFLTVEERKLLEDWEFLLCDTSSEILSTCGCVLK